MLIISIDVLCIGVLFVVVFLFVGVDLLLFFVCMCIVCVVCCFVVFFDVFIDVVVCCVCVNVLCIVVWCIVSGCIVCEFWCECVFW